MVAPPTRLRAPAHLRPRAPRWARLVRWARLAALAPALVLAAGCGDDDDPTGNGGVDGSYSLTQFEGQTVPFTVDTDDGRVEVRGGDLTLSGGDYQVSFDIRVDGRRARDLDDAGTYERDGRRVRFSSSSGDEFEGTLSGRQLTIESDEITLRFDRD